MGRRIREEEKDGPEEGKDIDEDKEKFCVSRKVVFT
jgi:hypothetical protein